MVRTKLFLSTIVTFYRSLFRNEQWNLCIFRVLAKDGYSGKDNVKLPVPHSFRTDVNPQFCKILDRNILIFNSILIHFIYKFSISSLHFCINFQFRTFSHKLSVRRGDVSHATSRLRAISSLRGRRCPSVAMIFALVRA